MSRVRSSEVAQESNSKAFRRFLCGMIAAGGGERRKRGEGGSAEALRGAGRLATESERTI